MKDVYVHFHRDEHAFVDRVAEWIDRVADRHITVWTDFLDPRQQSILSMLANRSPDVSIMLWGGYDLAERKRGRIAPQYEQNDEKIEEIQLLAITAVDQRLQALQHSDYLGSILGTGIKRDKIGDIHVSESGCHCLVTKEIADYLRLHLNQVSRVTVSTEVISAEHLQIAEPSLEEMKLSVASMRLDGIASDGFRLSRAKIVEPIRAGRCRVNWRTQEDPSYLLQEGDMVSVKGLGRFKVLEVEGTTKKGRTMVRIGKFR